MNIKNILYRIRRNMKNTRKIETKKYEHIVHPFLPLYNEESEILILGSLPSVKSREQMFFYGHPQNRFWKLISALLNEEVPQTIDEKKSLLLRNHIALWDTIYSCDIIGSSDSSIKNVTVNDFTKILNKSDIRAIFANGNKAYDLYEKYVFETVGIKAVKLPSTSPANARWNLEKLETAYSEMLKYIAD